MVIENIKGLKRLEVDRCDRPRWDLISWDTDDTNY